MGGGYRVTCRLVSMCLPMLSLLTSSEDYGDSSDSSSSNSFFYFLKTDTLILASFKLATILLPQSLE